MLCDAYVLYFYVLWLLRCAAAFSSSYVKWCFCYVMLRFVVVPGVLHWSFSLLLAYNFHIHPANGKQVQIAEEIYQAVLSNRKPENADNVHSANHVSNYRNK